MNEATNASASTPDTERAPVKKPRGFAAMDREKVRAIAAAGGKAAHAAGTAHQFTAEEARVAGKKGGVAPHARRGRHPAKPAETAPVNASGGEAE